MGPLRAEHDCFAQFLLQRLLFAGAVIFQPEHVFDVKRVDNLFTVGRNNRARDIDICIGEGLGQIKQQAGAVTCVDLDDGVDFRAVVIKDDGGRHFERAFALFDFLFLFLQKTFEDS